MWSFNENMLSINIKKNRMYNSTWEIERGEIVRGYFPPVKSKLITVPSPFFTGLIMLNSNNIQQKYEKKSTSMFTTLEKL